MPRAAPGSHLNGNGASNADALGLYANGMPASEQDNGCVLSSSSNCFTVKVLVWECRALEQKLLHVMHLNSLQSKVLISCSVIGVK